MPRPRSVYLALLGVALAGLASCGPDRVGRTPATTVVHGSLEVRRSLRHVSISPAGAESFPLETWGKLSAHAARLTGVIDVGADGPVFTEVIVTCSNGDQPQLVRSTRFERTSRIPLFKVLPEDLLTRDLATAPVSCNFNVQLSDDGRLKFSNPFLADFSADAGDLVIERPPADDAKVDSAANAPLSAHHLQGTRVKPGADARWARLSCTDADFPAVPIEGVFDLNAFPVDRPIVRDGHRIDLDLASRPDQTCRIATYDRDLRSPDAITPSFKMNFDGGTWRITARAPEGLPYADTIAAKVDVPIGEYIVKNLEDRARIVRMNQGDYVVRLDINPWLDPTVVTVMSVPWVRVYRDRPHGLVPLASGETLVIPARASVRLQLRFYAPNSLGCKPSRVRASLADEIYLQELNPRGMVLNSTPLPSPVRRTIVKANPDYVFDDVIEHLVPGACASVPRVDQI